MNITDYFPQYTEVGYAKKSYGVNGHMRVFVEDEFKPSLAGAKHCFFLLKGCLVPYFIKNVDVDLVKFESCGNPEDTKVIASRSIYLHNDQLVQGEKEVDNSFQMVKGYVLVNADTEEEVGLISKVEEYPEQEIAIVIASSGTHMVPLNFQNVKGIDQEGRLVFVEIPEGLLDL